MALGRPFPLTVLLVVALLLVPGGSRGVAFERGSHPAGLFGASSEDHPATVPQAGSGTWCGATGPFSDYVNLTTADGSGSYDTNPLYANITSGAGVEIPAFWATVNVTAQSREAGEPVASAHLFFNATYDGWRVVGDFPLSSLNATTAYTGDLSKPQSPSLFGWFLPGFNVSFSVSLSDPQGCTLHSPIYAFTIIGARGCECPNTGIAVFMELVADAGAGRLVSGVNITISNATWSEATRTGRNGIASLPDGAVWLGRPLPYGRYNVSATYLGSTQRVAYDLTLTSNKTLLFVFNRTATPEGFLGVPGSEGYLIVLSTVALVAAAVVSWGMLLARGRPRPREEGRRPR